MKLIVATLLACFCVAITEASLVEKEAYEYDVRAPLGHFKQVPFTDLYKHYATAFVFPKSSPTRDNDDYRNYMPSGEQCMLFFQSFYVNDYLLNDLDELVVLDGCLGYLYESEFHEKDKEESQLVKENLDTWISDEKLKALYDGTKVNEFSDEAQDCVGDLLLDIIRAKHQYRDVVCNHVWLNVMIKFAKCHHKLPTEAKDTDSYGKIIYDLVKKRGQSCFNHELSLITGALTEDYTKNYSHRFLNALKFKSAQSSQARERVWSPEIMRLLTAVQGNKGQINLREIHRIVRGVSLNDPNFVQRFLNNMAKFADEKIKPKKNDKANLDDANGIKRYRREVDKLCQYFRASDSDKFYDFATPYISMVQILEHEDVFGITKKYFSQHVLSLTSSLYLSISSCNLLTFTDGAINRDEAPNKPVSYKVKFAKDTTAMVKWPTLDYY